MCLRISTAAGVMALSFISSAYALPSQRALFDKTTDGPLNDTVQLATSNLQLKAKSKRRKAERLQGGLTISPSAAKGDGYPTPGKAFEACGGAGNVFVIYDIGPDGQKSNHSYHCVD